MDHFATARDLRSQLAPRSRPGPCQYFLGYSRARRLLSAAPNNCTALRRPEVSDHLRTHSNQPSVSAIFSVSAKRETERGALVLAPRATYCWRRTRYPRLQRSPSRTNWRGPTRGGSARETKASVPICRDGSWRPVVPQLIAKAPAIAQYPQS